MKRGAADRELVFVATAALKSWVAVRYFRGEVEVPEEILAMILKKIR